VERWRWEVVVGTDLLRRVLPGSTLVVAIDPGKVAHRVWFSTGEAGLLAEPVSVSSLRPGLDEVTAAIRRLAGPAPPVVAIEATGGLHGSWVRALEERFPSSVRVFAPRRRRPPGRSSGRGGLSLMIVTALR
jgi:hypothetical protein